ncbi:single-stranded DNA-binding protein [Terriglobus roseus]|uniref:Single-stranded DNA-binding protein n=1 Tax=Terriglobus roseus TaxID=392734 RepID=A0A1H4KBD1_9BACT|nr:single-stranded DNA-binding protein [Terriglobus roseus]SEB55864.1 single-strand binding protein [Terriglobus roseus]
MAKGVNKVMLLGNVGKDPEMRATQGGMVIASFSLATADRAKDATGNWVDKTEWHNLVCFGRTAEIVRDYVKKGSQLFVEGKIQTRSWDDKESGQKKYRTEILVNELSLLGGRGEGGSAGGSGQYSGGASRSGGNSYGGGNTASFDQRTPAGANDYAGEGITDDDIPF